MGESTGDGAASRVRVLGQLGAADGGGTVRIEDRYDTDVDDLWSALTDPERLLRWYGEVDGDLRHGGRFSVYLAGPDLRGEGVVEECDRPRLLRVTTRETDESWRRGGGVPPFDQTLEATLTADGDHTVLVIEVRGLPLDKVAVYGAGFQIHAENLADHLAGREPSDPGSRWSELVPVYDDLADGLV